MVLLRGTLAISLATLAVFQPASVSADTCTSDEQTTIENVYSDLANSTACKDLLSDTDASSLDYCMNKDCISEISTVVDKLPECTGNDIINRRAGLQALVTNCAKVTESADDSSSTASDTLTSSSAAGSNPKSGTSGASRSAFTTAAVIAPLSVVFYLVMGL